jgi:hypothetical protein
MAYHRFDNISSCLGCVTDWQQGTRSLFLLPSVFAAAGLCAFLRRFSSQSLGQTSGTNRGAGTSTSLEIGQKEKANRSQR